MGTRRTLLSIARRAGVRVGYPCRGEGLCGRCTVEVIDGSEAIGPPGAHERELAERAGLGERQRVSCLCTPTPGHEIVLRVGGGEYRIRT